MTNKLKAQIVSLPDRENVVYEIYAGLNQVAEISNEPGSGMQIEIFTCPDGGIWQFDYEEFHSLIEGARKNLAL